MVKSVRKDPRLALSRNEKLIIEVNLARGVVFGNGQLDHICHQDMLSANLDIIGLQIEIV